MKKYFGKSITPRSILYKESYSLSELFSFTIIDFEQDWEPAYLIEASIDGQTIKIIPSYIVYYNREGKYIPAMNGANYYYNNKGYEVFGNFEALSTYIGNYCFQFGILNKNSFDILIPQYIVVFEESVIDGETSLDLYIGSKKEL